MRRLLLVLAALASLLGHVAPAHAIPPPWMSAGACNGVVVSVAFGNNAPPCQNGHRVGDPTELPGWTFSRASSETCYWSDGHTTTALSGVPCITDLGLAVWQASTNKFLNSATGVTQTVTTTAASWTLSEYGAGSVTMSGTCSGTLAGTGATTRVSLTVTATAGSCVLTVSGSVTSVQFEAAAGATPYIPTTGAAATRAADLPLITGLSLGSGGTLYVAATRNFVSGTQGVASFNSGASTNRVDLRQTGTQTSSIGTIAGSTVWTMAFNFTSTAGVPFRAAVSYAAGAQSLTLNGGGGGAMATATSATVPSLASQLQLGGLDGGTSNQLNGYIQRAALYAQPNAPALTQ